MSSTSTAKQKEYLPMKKSNAVKNAVILTNRKLHFTYSLTDAQLEEFLDRHLDLIILSENEEPQNKLKITSHNDGIIVNHSITQSCWDTLSNYLNAL